MIGNINLDKKSTNLILSFFSSPEPKAHGELIVNQSSRRPSVRACVRPCLLNIISLRPVDRLQPNFI